MVPNVEDTLGKPATRLAIVEDDPNCIRTIRSFVERFADAPHAKMTEI